MKMNLNVMKSRGGLHFTPMNSVLQLSLIVRHINNSWPPATLDNNNIHHSTLVLWWPDTRSTVWHMHHYHHYHHDHPQHRTHLNNDPEECIIQGSDHHWAEQRSISLDQLSVPSLSRHWPSCERVCAAGAGPENISHVSSGLLHWSGCCVSTPG